MNNSYIESVYDPIADVVYFSKASVLSGLGFSFSDNSVIVDLIKWCLVDGMYTTDKGAGLKFTRSAIIIEANLIRDNYWKSSKENIDDYNPVKDIVIFGKKSKFYGVGFSFKDNDVMILKDFVFTSENSVGEKLWSFRDKNVSFLFCEIASEANKVKEEFISLTTSAKKKTDVKLYADKNIIRFGSESVLSGYGYSFNSNQVVSFKKTGEMRYLSPRNYYEINLRRLYHEEIYVIAKREYINICGVTVESTNNTHMNLKENARTDARCNGKYNFKLDIVQFSSDSELSDLGYSFADDRVISFYPERDPLTLLQYYSSYNHKGRIFEHDYIVGVATEIKRREIGEVFYINAKIDGPFIVFSEELRFSEFFDDKTSLSEAVNSISSKYSFNDIDRRNLKVLLLKTNRVMSLVVSKTISYEFKLGE